jgi:hypothetical protein
MEWQKQRDIASRVVNKFCMKMIPALNDEPVNAHLLTRSMDMEIVQKKTAELVNFNGLTSAGRETVSIKVAPSASDGSHNRKQNNDGTNGGKRRIVRTKSQESSKNKHPNQMIDSCNIGNGNLGSGHRGDISSTSYCKPTLLPPIWTTGPLDLDMHRGDGRRARAGTFPAHTGHIVSGR